jgi:hypothetical protein
MSRIITLRIIKICNRFNLHSIHLINQIQQQKVNYKKNKTKNKVYYCQNLIIKKQIQFFNKDLLKLMMQIYLKCNRFKSNRIIII